MTWQHGALLFVLMLSATLAGGLAVFGLIWMIGAAPWQTWACFGLAAPLGGLAYYLNTKL